MQDKRVEGGEEVVEEERRKIGKVHTKAFGVRNEREKGRDVVRVETLLGPVQTELRVDYPVQLRGEGVGELVAEEVRVAV